MAASLGEAVRSGKTLSEALARFPWIPEEHVAYLRIGETTGRLDLLLGKIVARLDARREMRRELMTRAAYPITLVVAATVLLPLPLVVLGSIGTYFAIVLSCVLPLGLIGLLIVKGRSLFPPGSAARPAIERALLGAPGLGAVLGDASLGRALGCLGTLLEAGASLSESLELSARVSGWQDFRVELRSVDPRIRSGRTLSEALAECAAFRERQGVIARIGTGEKAGRVGEALLRSGEDLEERAFRKTITAIRIVPFILIPLVGAVILLAALRVYSGMRVLTP
jgi:type IV pilus assembly protein PilC